ncbi:hypothetical protein D3C84_388050 [compost metagenome]
MSHGAPRSESAQNWISSCLSSPVPAGNDAAHCRHRQCQWRHPAIEGCTRSGADRPAQGPECGKSSAFPLHSMPRRTEPAAVVMPTTQVDADGISIANASMHPWRTEATPSQNENRTQQQRCHSFHWSTPRSSANQRLWKSDGPIPIQPVEYSDNLNGPTFLRARLQTSGSSALDLPSVAIARK